MGRFRTRGRNDLRRPTTGYDYVNIYEHTSIPGSFTGYDWNYSESFSDVLSDPEDAFKVHPCSHSLYKASHFVLPRLTNYLGNYIGWREPTFVGTKVDDLPSLFPGPSEPDKARLAEAAFNAMFQQMPQQVDILNFLWELPDLKDMIPKVEEGLAKTAAGGYLTYSFGYAPFVSDVTKLVHLSKSVADRLNYLRRTWGKETRVSYEGTFEVPDLVTEQPSGSTTSGSPHRITRPGYTGHYRAGGYLYHRLNDLYGVEGTLRGFAGALGLNNPVGALWESVPYSFVADWFTRSKEVVNHLAVQPYEGVWEIRRLTHSFSWECVWYTDLHYTDGGSYTPPYIPIEEGTCKHYTRGLGLPVSSSILMQEGLDPRQQTLAAALLASAR